MTTEESLSDQTLQVCLTSIEGKLRFIEALGGDFRELSPEFLMLLAAERELREALKERGRK
jgi:hypothetical protein